MQLKLLKYILDIEAVIDEIETIKLRTENDFLVFSKDIFFKER